MNQIYKEFYRRHGIRLEYQLMSPPPDLLTNLELPRGSVLHHYANDLASMGPNGDNPLFKGYTSPVMMDTVTELSATVGNPRPTIFRADPNIRDYLRKNRWCRQIKDYQLAIRNERTLVVINYDLLPHLYRYQQSMWSDYNRWSNIQATIVSSINTLMDHDNRQHFLMFDLPEHIPTVAEVRIGAKERLGLNALELFDTPVALTCLELLKWVGEAREHSLFNGIELQKLHRLNLIVRSDTAWFVINLGVLNSFRKVGGEELVEGEVETGNSDPAALMRRFLVTLLKAKAMDVDTVDKVIEVTDEENIESTEIEDSDSNEWEEDNEIKTPTEELETSEAEIDEILEQMESKDEFNQRTNEDPKPVKLKEYRVEEPTFESVINKKIDELVNAGKLSAAEVRRLQKLSKRSDEISNPFGDGSLSDLIDYKSVNTSVESDSFKDRKSVIDKSHLHSSIAVMDSKYAKEFMQKDIASMVMNAQMTGVIVDDYKVEIVEDIVNKYHQYSIRFVPVVGAPSTINFRVPYVESDGTYIANGVRNTIRKQRVDVPIRKVNPETVTLTSYYSKFNVIRGRRNASSYSAWLFKQLQLALINDESPVSALREGNNFYNKVVLPRTYTAIALRFLSVTLGDIELKFNYQRRFKGISETTVTELEQVEKEYKVVYCGHQGKKTIFMDTNGTLYINSGTGDMKVLGTLEELAKLNQQSRPIELAEAKIFGSYIPVGIVLAHEMGLDNLINYLKLPVRRVPKGERVHVSEYEYSITFNDEVLVFPREHYKASLVMGGFIPFQNMLKNYPSNIFNQKDIYLNVLESHGLSTRYIREMDLMYQLWIDPITKGVLQEMKEPTDFTGLLIRSCELLVTDDHPDEMDLRFMRFRGNEQIAGAVYNELVKSLRVYNRNYGSSKAKVDMSPFAIWQNIAENSAGQPIKETNPIHALKEQETVTFGGSGGRSTRTMVASTRAFHENDVGIISEATVDSGDVGVITYLTADPNITSVRGLTKDIGDLKGKNAKLLSTAALISPSADRDD